ncbi:MAG: plasmid mobilization protein [Methylocella sp.]
MTRRTPPFRRGGRPRKTDTEKRKLLISARVRQDELAIIEGRAAQHNIPLSDFLREQALYGAILVRKLRKLSAIDRHDLARIGSNLN